MFKELILIGWYSFLGIFSEKYIKILECYKKKLKEKSIKVTGFETNRSNLDILFGNKHNLENEKLEEKWKDTY